MTAKSIIKHDSNNKGPPFNVVLVGTKLDKVYEDERGQQKKDKTLGKGFRNLRPHHGQIWNKR